MGTPIYVAPEVMRGERYSSKVDVYSFGVILVAMIRAEANIIEFFFESLRLKTDFYEMIVSQHGNFTLVVIQMEEVAEPVAAAGEKKEGEGEEKKAE